MGIIFGQEVGLTQVCFDRDSLGVIVELEDAIMQQIFSQKKKEEERKEDVTENLTLLGHLFEEMKLLLKVLVSVNKAAHRLAKMAGCLDTKLVWLEEVPVRLKSVIDSDVPHCFFQSNFTHFSFLFLKKWEIGKALIKK